MLSIGLSRFPATRKTWDGEKILAAFCTAEVFCTPSENRINGFSQLPKSVSTQTTSFFISAAVIIDGKVQNEAIESTNKANLFAVTQALDFAVSVFGTKLTELGMNVYIKIDAPMRTPVLGGTSLGLATAVALMGFDCKNLDYVFTGYINNEGNAYSKDDALKVIVHAIDEAKAKVVGCVKSKTSLILPASNRRDVFGPYERPPDVSGWTYTVYPQSNDRLLNITYYRGRDVVKIVFANTMKDVVGYLTTLGLVSTMRI
jgi:hypothetical protein